MAHAKRTDGANRAKEHVGPAGELTLPPEMRRALGLRAGDVVEIEWSSDGVALLRRGRAALRQAAAQARDLLTDAADPLSPSPTAASASERGVAALRADGGALEDAASQPTR